MSAIPVSVQNAAIFPISPVPGSESPRSVAFDRPHLESAVPERPDDNEFETRPDEELVRLAQAGSGPAFGELVRRYHRECMQRAIHILGNYSDAEDQVQNAYWKALQSIE